MVRELVSFIVIDVKKNLKFNIQSPLSQLDEVNMLYISDNQFQKIENSFTPSEEKTKNIELRLIYNEYIKKNGENHETMKFIDKVNNKNCSPNKKIEMLKNYFSSGRHLLTNIG